jgi:hypothetical protein
MRFNHSMVTAGRSRAFLLAAAFGLVAAATPRPAYAQRGEDFTLNEELTVAPQPNHGFPGLLDTEVAPAQGWVINLPATSIYYGVSSRLTIGTVAAAAPLLFFGPEAYAAHARYRLASTSWFRTTLDALMIAGDASVLGGEGTLRLGLFGSNTEFALSPRQRILGHVWLGRAALGDLFSAAERTTALAVGASYAAVLREWVSVQVSVLYLAHLSKMESSEGADAQVDLWQKIDPHNRWAFRAVASFRKGRWLFDAGAFKAGPGRWPLPWLNVAVQLGGAS